MCECQHKWIFQEKLKSYKVVCRDGGGNYNAEFTRIDRYYCEKCLEIKEMKKAEVVCLPFGGCRHPLDFSPTWY